MKKPTITATQLNTLLVKSNAVLSEKLTAEEYAQVTEDIAELNARLETQEQGNQKLKEDLAAANTAKTGLESEKAQLEEKITGLNTQVKDLEPYKVKVEQIQRAGKNLPGEDPGSREGGENKLPDNHPNAYALNLFKREKGL